MNITVYFLAPHLHGHLLNAFEKDLEELTQCALEQFVAFNPCGVSTYRCEMSEDLAPYAPHLTMVFGASSGLYSRDLAAHVLDSLAFQIMDLYYRGYWSQIDGQIWDQIHADYFALRYNFRSRVHDISREYQIV